MIIQPKMMDSAIKNKVTKERKMISKQRISARMELLIITSLKLRSRK